MVLEAWKIGTYATNSMTGKTLIVCTVSVVNGAAAAYLFQRNGANYLVTAGKTFYATGMLFFGNYLGGTNGTVPEPIVTADNTALTTNPLTVFTLPAVANNLLPAVIIPVGFTAAASRYIGVLTGAASTYAGIVLMGYEA